MERGKKGRKKRTEMKRGIKERKRRGQKRKRKRERENETE